MITVAKSLGYRHTDCKNKFTLRTLGYMAGITTSAAIISIIAVCKRETGEKLDLVSLFTQN